MIKIAFLLKHCIKRKFSEYELIFIKYLKNSRKEGIENYLIAVFPPPRKIGYKLLFIMSLSCSKLNFLFFFHENFMLLVK